MKTYIVSDIVWDGGDSFDLPTRMEVQAEDSDSAVDVASDITGWCIKSASVEEK